MTVCTDTPEKIKAGHPKHALQATMLSRVTDLFGIRNQKIQTGPPGKPQPVPTTILTDANGIVRWIDQSVNYQRRSEPEVVLDALRKQ